MDPVSQLRLPGLRDRAVLGGGLQEPGTHRMDGHLRRSGGHIRDSHRRVGLLQLPHRHSERTAQGPADGTREDDTEAEGCYEIRYNPGAVGEIRRLGE